MEWVKQQIIKKVISSIITHGITIIFAYLVSCSIAGIKINSLIPVYESIMLTVSHQIERWPGHSTVISSSCQSLFSSPSTDDVQNTSLYYSIFTHSNKIPSTGFQYIVHVHAIECVDSINSEDSKIQESDGGILKIKLYSETGVPILEKNSNFIIQVYNQSVSRFADKLNEQICFELTAELSTGGQLFGHMHDGCIRLSSTIDPSLQNRDMLSLFSKSYLNVVFSLDCKQDMYTRLLCFRPMKWILLSYMWIALSTSLMIVISTTLIVTKIIRFFIKNTVTMFLVKIFDYFTVFQTIKEKYFVPPRSTASPLRADESYNPLISDNDVNADNGDERGITQKQLVNRSDYLETMSKMQVIDNQSSKVDMDFEDLIRTIEIATIQDAVKLPTNVSNASTGSSGDVTHLIIDNKTKSNDSNEQLCFMEELNVSKFESIIESIKILSQNLNDLSPELSLIDRHMIYILKHLLHRARQSATINKLPDNDDAESDQSEMKSILEDTNLQKESKPILNEYIENDNSNSLNYSDFNDQNTI
ncbi:hypothetical protein GJ496_003274 [Pomphorhynchus laevis]|nr:hypothetical protein GJ496_003274 [Pomphorhynchus laevis]